MRIASYVALALGLGLLFGLLKWHGMGEVFRLLADSGLALLLVLIPWLVSLIPSIAAWSLLFLPGRRPAPGPIAAAFWMGRAVNTLLPVASIGGEVVKARLIVLWGTPGVDAAGSVMLEKTVQALATLAWGITGGVLLLVATDNETLARYTLIGMALLSVGIVALVSIQYAGLFKMLDGVLSRVLPGLSSQRLKVNAHRADECVRSLLHRPLRLASAVCLRFLALVLQTGELWLAAHLLGHPISLVEALVLRSIATTVTDVAFVFPAGFGLQEGALLVVGAALGFPAPFLLALALATRLHELAIDLPALAAWQWIERNAFVRRSKTQRLGESTAD